MERRPLSVKVVTETWRDSAACKGTTPSIFIELDLDSHRQAKEYCDTCTVPEPCIEEAIRNRETGTRGGVIFRNGKQGRPNRRPGRQPKNPPFEG